MLLGRSYKKNDIDFWKYLSTANRNADFRKSLPNARRHITHYLSCQTLSEYLEFETTDLVRAQEAITMLAIWNMESTVVWRLQRHIKNSERFKNLQTTSKYSIMTSDHRIDWTFKGEDCFKFPTSMKAK